MHAKARSWHFCDIRRRGKNGCIRPKWNIAGTHERVYELAPLEFVASSATDRLCYSLSETVGKAMKPVEAIHRKLRGLRAVVKDAVATEHERANAKALKTVLEKKLGQEDVPTGDWTKLAFRFGRTVREIKTATSPPPPVSGTSKIAFRLGRALRQGLKTWRST